jgi:hypothetical protein
MRMPKPPGSTRLHAAQQVRDISLKQKPLKRGRFRYVPKSALGTVARLGVVPWNQSFTNLNLLKVVGLNSYRTSTRATAFSTCARGRQEIKISPKSHQMSDQLRRQVVMRGYNFDYIGKSTADLTAGTLFILLGQSSEANTRPPALTTGDRQSSFPCLNRRRDPNRSITSARREPWFDSVMSFHPLCGPRRAPIHAQLGECGDRS